MQKTFDTGHLHDGKIPYVTTWGLEWGGYLLEGGVFWGAYGICNFTFMYKYFSLHGQVSIVIKSCI